MPRNPDRIKGQPMTDPLAPLLVHKIRNAVAAILKPHHNPNAETQLFLLLGELEDTLR